MPMDGLHQWGDELTEDQHRVYAGIQIQHGVDVENGGGPQAMLRAIEGWQLTCDHPLLAAKIWSKVEEEATPALIRQSAKLNSTIAILRNVRDRGEKALVFSKFRATQLLLKRVIQDTFGVDVSIINGDVPSSQQAATSSRLCQEASPLDTGHLLSSNTKHWNSLSHPRSPLNV